MVIASENNIDKQKLIKIAITVVIPILIFCIPVSETFTSNMRTFLVIHKEDDITKFIIAAHTQDNRVFIAKRQGYDTFSCAFTCADRRLCQCASYERIRLHCIEDRCRWERTAGNRLGKNTLF